MRRLSGGDTGFAEQLAALLASRAEPDASVVQTVADIIAKVRTGGDAAVKELTKRFDKCELEILRLDDSRWKEEAAKCSADVVSALELAARRIACLLYTSPSPRDRG